MNSTKGDHGLQLGISRAEHEGLKEMTSDGLPLPLCNSDS